ncbi:unnamed protein product [Sphagnum balticum]
MPSAAEILRQKPVKNDDLYFSEYSLHHAGAKVLPDPALYDPPITRIQSINAILLHTRGVRGAGCSRRNARRHMEFDDEIVVMDLKANGERRFPQCSSCVWRGLGIFYCGSVAVDVQPQPQPQLGLIAYNPSQAHPRLQNKPQLGLTLYDPGPPQAQVRLITQNQDQSQVGLTVRQGFRAGGGLGSTGIADSVLVGIGHRRLRRISQELKGEIETLREENESLKAELVNRDISLAHSNASISKLKKDIYECSCFLWANRRWLHTLKSERSTARIFKHGRLTKIATYPESSQMVPRLRS